MAIASIALGPEENGNAVREAKTSLIHALREKHPFLQERFIISNADDDVSERIILAITPDCSRTQEIGECDYFYDLSAVLTLQNISNPPEELTIDDQQLTIYTSPQLEQCLVPPDWLMEALDDLDEEVREVLATHLTEQKRLQLESGEPVSALEEHLNALRRAYYHILGNDELHRV